MKQFRLFLKKRPLARISLIIIAILYFVMIFAEFFAPYSPNTTFEADTFHPANLELTVHGLTVRECRVINTVTWQYARVKGLSHPFRFFVKGEPYKLCGVVPCTVHLFGTAPDAQTGETYPVFLFGADNLGRDLFSRIVYGSRISLTIGFVASAISLVLAILLGGISGYYGGAADWSIMRLSEFFMLIPSLYLILFLRSLLGKNMDSGESYMVITVILSLVGWPGSARTVRGIVHAVKREEFVMDAGLEGVPSTVIIFRHIIPQMASLLIVSTTLAIPGFIMSETTLSYLGLGISDPAVSWGSLINRDISTLSNLRNYPWLLDPVWLLLIVTLAFNFAGDALRDFFDPGAVVFNRKKKSAVRKSCRSAKASFAAGPAAEKTHGHSADTAAGSAQSGTENVSHADCSAADPALLPPDTLLCVDNLHVTFSVLRGAEYADVQSVRGVSFTMRRGEVLGIVGESGSGKSVTTTAIPGLLPANAAVSGHIWWNNGAQSAGKIRGAGSDNKAGTGTAAGWTELTALHQDELRAYRGRRIGLIFQEPGRSFDPLQTIGAVFTEALRVSEPDMTKAAALNRAVELLAEVGLPNPEERLVNYPHQFSGGQLQRISIALALAQNCELLIADEPTTALDVTIQAQIVDLLLSLRRSRGLSIIFISHNIKLVSAISDDMIVMYGGIVMERGTADAVTNHARNPYTQALLAATPAFGMHYTEEPLVSIPGKVTDPAHPEQGCPFAPRCAKAVTACAAENWAVKGCHAVNLPV